MKFKYKLIILIVFFILTIIPIYFEVLDPKLVICILFIILGLFNFVDFNIYYKIRNKSIIYLLIGIILIFIGIYYYFNIGEKYVINI